jgi:Ca2+-binding RTX toxin-like protein
MELGDGDDRASLAGACGYASMEGDFGCATTIHAGPGRDSVVANDVDGATVFGGDGRDFLFAGEMGSILRGGANSDHLIGAGGIDRLLGEGGTDFLWAGANNDLLRGGYGTDELRAGFGHDRARGGPGRDTIYARDRLRDVVMGGTGFDRARVDSRDAVSRVERLF